MTNAPTDYVNLPFCSKRKVIEIEDFANANPANRALAAQLVKEQLNSLDLIECVIKLADTPINDDVKVFLEMMVNKNPELVFMGLLQIDVSFCFLCSNLFCLQNISLLQIRYTRIYLQDLLYIILRGMQAVFSYLLNFGKQSLNCSKRTLSNYTITIQLL
jgi:hypothetical protein